MALPILNNGNKELVDVVELSTEISMDGFISLNAFAERQLNVLDSIKSIMEKQYEDFLASERERREREKEARNKIIPTPKNVRDGETESGGMGFPGALAFAIIASLSGLDDYIKTLKLPGNIKKIKNFFSSIVTFFKNLPELPTKILDKVPTDLGVRILQVSDFFKDLPNKIPDFPKIALPEGFSTRLTAVGDFFKDLPNKIPDFPKITLPEGLTENLNRVKGFMNTTFDFLAKTGGVLKGFTLGAVDTAVDIFKSVKNFISPVFDFLAGLAPIQKALGVLGKALRAFPLVSILLSVVDFFEGFYDGFKDDGGKIDEQRTLLQKTIDGVKEGLYKVFEGIITLPLDLIKDGISWVFSKLGLDVAADALDSFSFTGAFRKIVRALEVADPTEAFKNVFKFIYNEETGEIFGINFKELFDVFPSFDDIQKKLESFIPNILKSDDSVDLSASTLDPGADEVDLKKLKTELDAGNKNKVMKYLSDTKSGDGIENEEEVMKILKSYGIDDIPQAAKGGITPKQPGLNKIGSLINIHPQEAIIPLEKTGEFLMEAMPFIQKSVQGVTARSGDAIYAGSNEVADSKTAPTIIAPTTISDNSVKTSSVTHSGGSNNVRSMDDSIRDFINSPYR